MSASPSGSFQPSRREFLKGAVTSAGAFMLAIYIPFKGIHSTDPVPQGKTDPNVFLRIGLDDSVTVLSKHLEMGQGAATGLATIVAEELDADWSKVKYEFAPNDASLYNNLLFGPVMGTGGSTSMAEAWDQMRSVGAAARMMLIAAAAQRWNVPAEQITAANSVVSHSSGKRATFGELASDAMKQPVPTNVKLKDGKEWKLIGHTIPRLDSVPKTTGQGIFALDVRRPEMLTVVVKHPPVFGAKAVSFDPADARKVEGVVDVQQISSGVAVYAKDTWSAMEGRDALKVTWDKSQAETRSSSEMLAEYRQMAQGKGLAAEGRGDAAAAMKNAAKVVEGEFAFPFLAHAPMEPLNCVIELHGDGAEIWMGSQLQTVDEAVVAKVLGLKPQQVRINTLHSGGSFGRRANPVGDWAAEAAESLKAIQGRAPVHLVWTREDDIRGGYYRPMVYYRVKAGLTSNGQIAGWQHTVVSKPILLGTPFEAFGVKNGVDHSTIEGIVDSPYAISDMAIEVHNAKTSVPVLWWRSVGHTHSAFVMETMLDDLAHAAGKDPVALRLDLLAKQPRDAAVVKLAAEKAAWGTKPRKGQGRGFAYHKSFESHVAMVTDVTVSGDSFKVDRVVAAVDCGVPINPDVIKAQVQGAIGFALSATLRNQITFHQGEVLQSNFDDYEPTRIHEMPAVEVYIVPSTEHPTGIGEPGVPPLAPSIGNAIFAATGKRMRSLPFDLIAAQEPLRG
ncbi:MAG TPA: xanthine dehydrogenase family protein molybdopterin-binding subunit [Terriglobales bacterium]|nr:xanthine dehydrogenase family protein molybdopterin-binding subunit [Terriglobales bacterium]